VTPRDPYQAEIARAVRYVVADDLMRLVTEAEYPQARALALAELDGLRRQLELTRARTTASAADRAQAAALSGDLRRFLEAPGEKENRPREPIAPPPGSPIGAD
jgi:hypothetical protein